MSENLVPIVIMTGMFAMIFGIVYIRSRENMAMIDRGLNPRNRDASPRPFANLKWGLLLIGSGLGLLLAYIIDNTMLDHNRHNSGAHFAIGRHHTFGGHRRDAIKDAGMNLRDTTAVSKDSTHLTGTQNVTVSSDADNEESHSIAEVGGQESDNPAIYFALIAIGGGLGLFFSYRIEKKEWLDKRINA